MSCSRATLSSKTWCRSPKTIAKRKFDLLPRNLFVKNMVSAAQNCNKRLFFHSAKQVSRFSTNSYVFEHAGVAKRKALHFGMHFAVAGRIFSFCWMNRPSRRIRWVDRAKLSQNANFKLHEFLRVLYWRFQCSANGSMNVGVTLCFCEKQACTFYTSRATDMYASQRLYSWLQINLLLLMSTDTTAT